MWLECLSKIRCDKDKYKLCGCVCPFIERNSGRRGRASHNVPFEIIFIIIVVIIVIEYENLSQKYQVT